MFAKWKGKIKAAIKEAKDKRKEKQNSKHSAGEEKLVAPVQQLASSSNDGLSRPHGLGGRKSLDTQPAPGKGPAGAAGNAAVSGDGQHQQHQHAGQSSLLHQLDQQQVASSAAQQQQQQQQQSHHEHAGVRSAAGADPASTAALLQDTPAGGDASALPAAAAGAAAGDNTEQGSTLGATAAAAHKLDASRIPRDEELGTCPPYAAKAVWGLRYTMEDKWAAVPNLIQLPLVLTSPPKKSRGAKSASGCGCMIPAASAAASKVLSKVSPMGSRLGSSSGSSGGKDSGAKHGSSGGSAAAAAVGANPGLEKPSPDRQRLIGQGPSSSDEQGAAAAAPSDAAGVAGLGQGPAAASAAAAAAAAGVGPGPGMDALHYFGVFDGHGGADAARHCAQHMHQTVCSTILSMLSPEVAAAAVVSSLATSSRHPTTSDPGAGTGAPAQQQPQQQLDEEPAELPTSSAAAMSEAAAAASNSSSSNTAAAAAAAAASTAAAAGSGGQQQPPMPAIDIAASNGSWLLPALSRSFVSLDREFGVISEGSYVGSTAVVVLIGSSRVWVAHAGDSRAVLGRGGSVQVLTSDHKASRDDEVARVQAAGGHVWWDRVMGELAVSRAIGDHCLRPYVIPEPELLMLERTAEDEVLVMASDGLWDVMNNQEAVDMAVHSLQAAQASGHAGVAALKRSANALTKAALERGTRDNVTVLVVDLRPRKPGTNEAAAVAAATSSSSSNHTGRHSSSSRSHGHSSRSSKKAAATAASTGTAAAPAAAVSAHQMQQCAQPQPPPAAAAADEAAAAAAAPAGVQAPAAVAAQQPAAAGGLQEQPQQLERADSAGETRPLVTQQQRVCS